MAILVLAFLQNFVPMLEIVLPLLLILSLFVDFLVIVLELILQALLVLVGEGLQLPLKLLAALACCHLLVR